MAKERGGRGTYNGGITKREIIKELSDTTELREDIVEDVFNALQDLMIREILTNETFVFPNVFSVYGTTIGERKGYNKKFEKVVTYPETRRLVIKLSRKINYYQRWKMRTINNEKAGVTPDNWIDQLKDLEDEE